MQLVLVSALLLLYRVNATTFLEDHFETHFKDRWTVSDWKKSQGSSGKFIWSAGRFAGDETDKGLQTSEDMKFYAISTKLSSPIQFAKSVPPQLVIQFSVKHEQRLMPACGGGYVKLLPRIDAAKFGGESPFIVTFGPDICGTQTRHVLLALRGKATPKSPSSYVYRRKEPIRCETDQGTHLYTLVLKGDSSSSDKFTDFEIHIDGVKRDSGSLDFQNTNVWQQDGNSKSSGATYLFVDDAESVGFELWQVKAGSLFDNIVVSDDVDKAREQWKKTFTFAEKEKEDKLIKEFLDKEEEEHRETTRRIQEMRRKQDIEKEGEKEGSSSTSTSGATDKAYTVVM